MGSADESGGGQGSEEDQIRAVVPARAVLTELARGFLLVHDTDPQQALRFAETFLKEQTAGRVSTPSDPGSRVTRARLALGRLPHGAVEPSSSGRSPGPGGS